MHTLQAPAMTSPKPITTEEFDEKFDNGEDVSEYLDWSKARRPNQEARRVNVDFPAWMVRDLDKEAGRLGVTRQSLIKMWIAGKLG
ncbi:MAG: type II toxin-antitoxin system BrnA family antitoxin [Paracoccaceae bacterium]